MKIVKDSKKEYTPAPEGLHPAVCIDVIDLGIVKTAFGEKPQYEIRWVIEEIDPKTQMPHMVLKRFTPSLHKKSNLRSTLEAWRGRKFNEEELKGFDIDKLIGANCQVQIIHNITSDGDVYANIQAVVPAAKGAAKLSVPTDYIRVEEREKRAEFERHPDGNGHANGKENTVEDSYIPF